MHTLMMKPYWAGGSIAKYAAQDADNELLHYVLEQEFFTLATEYSLLKGYNSGSLFD
jgi:hypothetical protein